MASDSGRDSVNSGDFNEGRDLDCAFQNETEPGVEETEEGRVGRGAAAVTSPSDEGNDHMLVASTTHIAPGSRPHTLPSVDELMLVDMMTMSVHDQEVEPYIDGKSRLPSVDSAVVVNSPVEFTAMPPEYVQHVTAQGVSQYHVGSGIDGPADGLPSSTTTSLAHLASGCYPPASYQVPPTQPPAYPSAPFHPMYQQRMASPVFNVSWTTYANGYHTSTHAANPSPAFTGPVPCTPLPQDFLTEAGPSAAGLLPSPGHVPVTTDGACLASMPPAVTLNDAVLSDALATTPCSVSTPEDGAMAGMVHSLGAADDSIAVAAAAVAVATASVAVTTA